MDSRQPGLTPADAGKAEKRTPRSIRFYDPEWERIESFADKRGVAAAEFVRFAALAAIEDGSGALSDPAPRGRLAPLIEMTFRAAYMLATKMRDEMLDADRKEELDALVAAARGLQDELLVAASD